MPPPIEWRVHFSSSPEEVFKIWSEDEGRQRFWCETSRANATGFTLGFINGQSIDIGILEVLPPSRFVFRYFGGSQVTLSLAGDDKGGCDLLLIEEGVPAEEHLDNYAGWVSVLLACKAALDFGVDLRSHDPARSGDQCYVDP